MRQFIVEAYVRGGVVGCAERAELEGSTAVFAKRRFRDRYNRIIVRRVGKTRNHTLKIKARVRARGARGQDAARETEREGEYVCVWGQSRARKGKAEKGKAGDREEWFSERRVSIAKKKSRTQMLWLLQLAGDWHSSVETATPHPHPHMMRVMIVSNLSVESRFANGTQGRLT